MNGGPFIGGRKKKIGPRSGPGRFATRFKASSESPIYPVGGGCEEEADSEGQWRGNIWGGSAQHWKSELR